MIESPPWAQYICDDGELEDTVVRKEGVSALRNNTDHSNQDG